jgi:hypothetical protein
MLRAAGLEPAARSTVGFGPLTLLGRPILGERAAIRVNGRLQRLADRHVPALRWTGWHYVVRAVRAQPA